MHELVHIFSLDTRAVWLYLCVTFNACLIMLTFQFN